VYLLSCELESWSIKITKITDGFDGKRIRFIYLDDNDNKRGHEVIDEIEMRPRLNFTKNGKLNLFI